MALFTNRRTFLGMIASTLAWFALPAMGQSTSRPVRPIGRRGRDDDYALPPDLKAFGLLSVVLGRITDKSVTVSSLASEATEGYCEYGTVAGQYAHKTSVLTMAAGEPAEVVLSDLQVDTQYFYRLRYRKPGEADFGSRSEGRFHTQRAAGGSFTFAVQGDSHPERPQMNDPELYARTLLCAADSQPDFYICMGDDFSIDTLRNYTADAVTQRYTIQRPFLGLVAQSAPLFLVNGNHEQASLFNYNQPGWSHDAAVWAQTARNRFFPMPAPDGFYTGDTQPLKAIGALRDYYAWTWGDALFVILDNYWHSTGLVDNPLQGSAQGGQKNPNWWDIGLGDAQYEWFKRTLEASKATFKFVFAHHVLGTGRGGVDEADLFEWGGNNRRGDREFAQKRPGWELPVHQLMVKHGVTIFFQGHDHLYAWQERDGVFYQEVPMPADQGYATNNQDRYQSAVKLPNSGYLRIAVSPEQVKVDYVRCYLPKDETELRKTGEIAHSYTIAAKAKHG